MNFLKKTIYLALPLLLLSCGQEVEKIPEQAKDFCAAIHNSDSTTLSKELDPLQDSLKNKTGVYVLEEGDMAMISRAWLCEHAEKTIDVQYFIFSTDNVGLIACDYLVRAADRGVKVRILVDDIMVDAGSHEILALDAHPNIDIKIYNPGINIGKNLFQKLKKFGTDFVSANQRMHNKTFTVDGQVCITGGRNIADEYFDYDHEYNFRDRDIMLMGKTVSSISTSFDSFWTNALSVDVEKLVKEEDTTSNPDSAHRYDRLHQYACNPDNFWPQVREKIAKLPLAFKDIQASGKLIWTDSVSFISDIPGKNDLTKGLKGGGFSSAALLDLINTAKTSIDIQSPYLISTPEVEIAFEAAVKRGVKIRILTNSLCSTDNLEAFSGYQKCREKLLKTGVRIFEFKPDAKHRFELMTSALQKKMNYQPVFGLHAKSMVMDGNTSVIGTFNLDPRSINLNTECVTVVHSVALSKGVLANMNIDFNTDNSWETTLNYNPDSEAGKTKRLKTWTKKIVPKSIL